MLEIVQTKKAEVALAKQQLPLEQLREMAAQAPVSARSMSAALASSRSGIIAEFKRKSPSKGWIHADAQCTEVVPAYAAGGASAISILTDEPYFGGSMDFVRAARPLVPDTPILRKDFIIDGYQLLQARLIGADAVLLIAACLEVEQCRTLAAQAHELGLEVLLEVHSVQELEHICQGVDMIGVNNRNLGSFHTDVNNSFRIAQALQEAVGRRISGRMPVLVSESGISDPSTVRQLRDCGYRGFLMGENFMKNTDPGASLAAFVKDVEA